jgi:hypothetical protein
MLKEFDLDAPKEAKEYRHKFGLETRCITALYERNFVTSKETSKTWKILVEVVPSVTDGNIRNLIGVLVVQCAFDVPSFFELVPMEKKKTTLEILEKGINMVLQNKGWDAAPFLAASTAIRKRNFVNEWVWRKPYRKPKSSIYIEVFCQHDLDSFKINFRFCNKQRNQTIIFPVANIMPTEFVFADYLGKAGWDCNRFQLFSKDGTLIGEIAVDDEGDPRPIFLLEKGCSR